MGELGDKFTRLAGGRKAQIDKAVEDADIGVRPSAQPKKTEEPTQTNTPMLPKETFKEYGKRLADLQDSWNQKK